MIKASEAIDLVKTYRRHELEKQSAITWLETNVEKEIKNTAAKGGTWVITAIPSDQYSLIEKILEELGYKISLVHYCQLKISWGD